MAKPKLNVSRKTNWTQGYYTLRNPAKYIGDSTEIRYMSKWELDMHRFLDTNEKVLRWSSEEIIIPYIKPTDGRIHKYYPDYYVEYINRAGTVIKEIIELKPLAQTRPPKANHKNKLYEQVTYAVNVAKWQAAKAFCDKNGFNFKIVTERSVYK